MQVVKTTDLQFCDESEIFTSKDGKCSGCGNCCSNLLPLTKSEIVTIKKYIKRHKIKPVDHYSAVTAEKSIDWICPFRHEQKGCLIYEVRPAVCRAYQCNKKPISIAKNLKDIGISRSQLNEYNVRNNFFKTNNDIEDVILFNVMIERSKYKALKMFE